jgi:hypothetical protein
MGLGGLAGMMLGLHMMAMGQMGMMAGGLVVAFLMMRGSFMMVLGRLLVMLGGMLMVLVCFLVRHLRFPFGLAPCGARATCQHQDDGRGRRGMKFAWGWCVPGMGKISAVRFAVANHLQIE